MCEECDSDKCNAKPVPRKLQNSSIKSESSFSLELLRCHQSTDQVRRCSRPLHHSHAQGLIASIFLALNDCFQMIRSVPLTRCAVHAANGRWHLIRKWYLYLENVRSVSVISAIRSLKSSVSQGELMEMGFYRLFQCLIATIPQIK